jgi:hypothetical protein
MDKIDSQKIGIFAGGGATVAVVGSKIGIGMVALSNKVIAGIVAGTAIGLALPVMAVGAGGIVFKCEIIKESAKSVCSSISSKLI